MQIHYQVIIGAVFLIDKLVRMPNFEKTMMNFPYLGWAWFVKTILIVRHFDTFATVVDQFNFFIIPFGIFDHYFTSILLDILE